MTANPKPTAEADVDLDDLTVCERLGGSCFVAYEDGRNDYTLAEEAIAEITRLHTNIDGLTKGVNTMACMVEEKEAEITRLRATLDEANMQALTDLGQAQDAWEAKLKVEGELAETARQRDRYAELTEKEQDRSHRLLDKLAEANTRADVAFAAGIEAAVGVLDDSEKTDGYVDIPCALLIDIIRALTPPDITAAAARVLQADEGVIDRLAGFFAETYGEPVAPFNREQALSALRTIAEGEK
ncbi:MAG: hypothetical protein ACRC52_07455 [Aeromonas veronii]